MFKSQYFKAYELVSKTVYDKYGEGSIKFINPKIVEFLHRLRVNLGKPIIVNTWKSGGGLSQRCLRENTCAIVKKKTSANSLYLSAHCFGNAVDLHVNGMNIQDVYNHVKNNYDLYSDLITRMEDISATGGNGFIHVDCMITESKSLTIFKP